MRGLCARGAAGAPQKPLAVGRQLVQVAGLAATLAAVRERPRLALGRCPGQVDVDARWRVRRAGGDACAMCEQLSEPGFSRILLSSV